MKRELAGESSGRQGAGDVFPWESRAEKGRGRSSCSGLSVDDDSCQVGHDPPFTPERPGFRLVALPCLSAQRGHTWHCECVSTECGLQR